MPQVGSDEYAANTAPTKAKLWFFITRDPMTREVKGLLGLSYSDDGSGDCDSCTSSSDDQDPSPAADAYSCAGDRKGEGPARKW